MAGRLRADGEPPPVDGEFYRSQICFNTGALFDVHYCLGHVIVRKFPFFCARVRVQALGFVLYVEFN
jgi:hypothetical protein